MTFDEFKTFLSQTDRSKLGGTTAQFKMAPSYRKAYDLSRIKANKPIDSAVLILFYPDINNKPCFVLTKRASYNGQHSNQVSFPGGKKDKMDSNLLNTALRETKEEIGVSVPLQAIKLELTDVYIPPSNYLVKVFVAVIDYKPQLKANYEVNRIFTPRLSQLLDSKNVKTSQVISSRDISVLSPSFIFDDSVVWGATAMMLSELKELFLSSKN